MVIQQKVSIFYINLETGSNYSIVFGEDGFEPQSESFRFSLKIVVKY